MHCPSCQTDNPEQARFCMVCGVSFQTGQAPPATTPPAPVADDTEDLTFGGPTLAPTKKSAPAAPVPTGEVLDLDLDGSVSGGATLAGGAQKPPSAASDLAAGMRMGTAERYKLVDKIGQGGMGSVWRAKDLSLDGRIVAMKRLLVFDEADRRMLERFEQERRTIAGLNHANVVTVFDAGSDDWGPYLVMEFVEGEPLDKLLKRERLDEERAVAIFEGLVRGVAHAHKKGVIHRDIKPANVILDGDGTPKLLDFGLARGAAGLELSMTGYGMGTLDYAAPEQKRDAKSVDHRADIYALGATFYELLTGLKPVPLFIAKVPPRWQALLGRCCEPDPAERYQAATEVLAAIDEARRASTIEAPTPAGPDEDDLSCPSCQRMNALDARFCRGCGEGLQVACPACETEYRVGLRHCDKCGASVEAIREGKARLEAAQEAFEGTRLGVAKREAAAGLKAIEGARLGGASSLKDGLQDVAKQTAEQEQQAKSLVKTAQDLESSKEYETALEKLHEAAALYDTHAKEAEDANSRYPALISARDGKRRLAEAQSAESSADYKTALSLYEEAAKLDDQHTPAHDRAQAILPPRIDLCLANERIKAASKSMDEGRYEDASESLSEARQAIPNERGTALDDSVEQEDSIHLKGPTSKALEQLANSEQQLSSLKAEANRSIAEIQRVLNQGDLEAVRTLQSQAGPWKSNDSRARVLNEEYKRQVERRDRAFSRIQRNTGNHLFLLLGSFFPSYHRELRHMVGRGGDLEKKACGLLLKLRIARSAILIGVLVVAVFLPSAFVPSALIGTLVVIRFFLNAKRLERERELEHAVAVLEARIRSADSLEGLRALKAKWGNSDAWIKAQDQAASHVAGILAVAIDGADSLEELSALKAMWSNSSAWLTALGQATSHLGGLLAAAIDGADSLEEFAALGADWCNSIAWDQNRKRFADKALPMVDALLAAKRPLTAAMVDTLFAAGRKHPHTASNGLELLAIPSGKFQMGSTSGASNEKPIHAVTLTQPFFLGQTEVTQGQWETVIGSNPSSHQGADLPVENVSWTECMEFCEKLAATDRGSGLLPLGWEYTLPTEAQWEYACRAGSRGTWCFGDSEGKLGEYGWYGANSGSETHPVGQRKANAWGFRDMHGNVWEWCRDWYDSGFYRESGARRDPYNSSSASNRVERGGSYGSGAVYLRSADRDFNTPGNRSGNVGFRLAMVATK